MNTVQISCGVPKQRILIVEALIVYHLITWRQD